jgi:hypothetical protein
MIRQSLSLLAGLAIASGIAPRGATTGFAPAATGATDFAMAADAPRSADDAARRFIEALATAEAQDYPWHPYEGLWTFVRIHFNDGRGDLRSFGRRRGFGDPGWRHDYPNAERNFSKILNEITYVRALQSRAGGNVLEWDDPRLFQFPIAYVSEPGDWTITEAETEAIRAYVLKGGFIIFDDFTGYAMYNLAEQMARVLPELRFLPLDGSEAIFDSFFKIEPFTIVLPSYRGARPEWWGLFLDNDKGKRMLAVAGNNSDLGEYWEYSDTGYFPVDLSNEAYKVGVNYIVFAMTH